MWIRRQNTSKSMDFKKQSEENKNGSTSSTSDSNQDKTPVYLSTENEVYEEISYNELEKKMISYRKYDDEDEID